MDPSLPLHPAVIHFPIAAIIFAAGAVALAHLRPGARAASLSAAALLLAVAVAGGLVAIGTGWRWADSLAYLAGGWGLLPGPKAVEGLARRHALLGLASVATAAIALVLVLRARRRDAPPTLALLAALLASALVGATGHLGGTMVHNPPPPADEGVAVER